MIVAVIIVIETDRPLPAFCHLTVHLLLQLRRMPAVYLLQNCI